MKRPIPTVANFNNPLSGGIRLDDILFSSRSWPTAAAAECRDRDTSSPFVNTSVFLPPLQAQFGEDSGSSSAPCTVSRSLFSTPPVAVSFEEVSYMQRLAFIQAASTFSLYDSRFVPPITTPIRATPPIASWHSPPSTPLLPVRTPLRRIAPVRDYRCLLPAKSDAVQQAAEIFFDAFYRHHAAVNALQALQNGRNTGVDKIGVNTTILFSLLHIVDDRSPLCLISFSGIYRDRAKTVANSKRIGISTATQDMAEKCYEEIETVVSWLNTQGNKTITFQLVDRANSDINKLLVGTEKALHGDHVSDHSVHADSGKRCAERSVLSELMVKNELYGSVHVIGSQAYAFAVNHQNCQAIPACEMCLKQSLAFYALIRLARITYVDPDFFENYTLDDTVPCKQMLVPFQIELQIITLITEALAERINMIQEFYGDINLFWPNDSKKTIEYVLSLAIDESRYLVLEIERYFDRVYAQNNTQAVPPKRANNRLSFLLPTQFLEQNSTQRKQNALIGYQNAAMMTDEILTILQSLKSKTSQYFACLSKGNSGQDETAIRSEINQILVQCDIENKLQQLSEAFNNGMHCHIKSPTVTPNVEFGKNLQDVLERICVLPQQIEKNQSIKDFHKQMIDVTRALNQLASHIQMQIQHCESSDSSALSTPVQATFCAAR